MGWIFDDGEWRVWMTKDGGKMTATRSLILGVGDQNFSIPPSCPRSSDPSPPSPRPLSSFPSSPPSLPPIPNLSTHPLLLQCCNIRKTNSFLADSHRMLRFCMRISLGSRLPLLTTLSVRTASSKPKNRRPRPSSTDHTADRLDLQEDFLSKHERTSPSLPPLRHPSFAHSQSRLI